MQVYYDKDADLETIKNNKVVIVGMVHKAMRMLITLKILEAMLQLL